MKSIHEFNVQGNKNPEDLTEDELRKTILLGGNLLNKIFNYYIIIFIICSFLLILISYQFLILFLFIYIPILMVLLILEAISIKYEVDLRTILEYEIIQNKKIIKDKYRKFIPKETSFKWLKKNDIIVPNITKHEINNLVANASIFFETIKRREFIEFLLVNFISILIIIYIEFFTSYHSETSHFLYAGIYIILLSVYVRIKYMQSKKAFRILRKILDYEFKTVTKILTKQQRKSLTPPILGKIYTEDEKKINCKNCSKAKLCKNWGLYKVRKNILKELENTDEFSVLKRNKYMDLKSHLKTIDIAIANCKGY